MVKNAGKTLAVLLVAAGSSLLIEMLGVGNESIIMVFLLGVLFTTVFTSSYGWGICVALLSVMLFNFLFTEPRYTFLVYSPSDLMLLVFFLVTAVVSGTVTSRLQREMELAGENEKIAQTLYKIASGFLSASGQEDVVQQAERLMEQYAGLRCHVLLQPSPAEETSPTVFPIDSVSGRQGILTLEEIPTEQQSLMIRAVATQLGIALDREHLVEEREAIRMAMERERQHTVLLRSVAHDLRTPLTALSGASSLLADSYEQLSDSERKKLSADISEEMIWLTDLVENILNMTRIGEEQLVLHKQDEVVDDVVGEAVSHTERLLQGHSFSVSLPDEVIAAPMDGKLIVQVLINLLENAVRHTTPDSVVRLSVDSNEQWLRISVADTGPGVPDSMKSRIFERFVRQDTDVVDGRQGLGLGLAICRTIIEAHGGTLCVTDNVPQGAVFTFTLPLEAQA